MISIESTHSTERNMMPLLRVGNGRNRNIGQSPKFERGDDKAYSSARPNRLIPYRILAKSKCV